MKRILSFLIIAGGMTMYAAALDFGVNLSNSTELNGTNKTFNISQANAVEAFVEFPVKDFSSIYISGEARFSGAFPINPKGAAQLLPIHQAFRLKRTDWSGSKIFNGGKINLIIKKANIAFALGYTGLTYKTDAQIKIDLDDIERLNNKKKVLAPQRLFFLLSASFQEVIPSHTIGFDALAQFDLLKLTGRTHTQYFIPYIHGRIGRNINWQYWIALQLGEAPKFTYSLASGLAVQYFNPNWRYFTVTGKLNWAAGNYDGTGPMRSFVPITDTKQTVVANGSISSFSNTLTGGLTVNARPIQGLLTELSYILLTSPNTIRSPAYMGSELSAKVAYQFHNDFDASFTGGIFIPNRKIITAYNLRWLTELTFTVKL